MKKANSNLLEENLRLHSSQIIHENPQIFPLKSSIDTELLTTKKSEEIESKNKLIFKVYTFLIHNFFMF